jgi:protease II
MASYQRSTPLVHEHTSAASSDQDTGFQSLKARIDAITHSPFIPVTQQEYQTKDEPHKQTTSWQTAREQEEAGAKMLIDLLKDIYGTRIIEEA